MNRFQEVLNHSLNAESRNFSHPLFHLKALERLVSCRTEKLGGHAQYCEDGHLNGVWYNSCKHRFCPQCNQINKERWILNTQRIVLDCPHHHVIFTLASELNPLWKYNRELMSDLLFKAVQETIKQFAKDKRYLGAMPGILMALHTWGRDMSLHPHVHALISHGGVNDAGQWATPRKQHLFPQIPFMLVFRGKFLSRLKEQLQANQITLPPDTCSGEMLNRLKRLYRKDWVVHFCERYDHARGVAKYLGRYIKGGPFKLSQLVKISAGQVKFQYKSHQTHRYESIQMDEQNFIRRLLEHVAIPGKPSLRYGGLYVSSVRGRLNSARQQLGQQQIETRIELGWLEYLGANDCLPVCKECGKLLTHKQTIETEQ